MTSDAKRIIVVTGATGRQGGAVARSLLKSGWHVRALTRTPNSQKAQSLASLGAEVIQGDMNAPQTLKAAFRDAYGVYSVQNHMLSNLDNEIKQGKAVAEAAKDVGIQYLVYGSAGIGKPTGVGSWDSKLQVEAHMKRLHLPLTILRPMAFMQLMLDQGYYPPVSTWHLMPKLMGDQRPVGWISTDDLGIIAAKVFADPDRFIDQEIKLASDVKSIAECRSLYRDVMGKNPPRFLMPVWMFKRFVGTDLITMWQWLKTETIDLDTQPTLAIHPDALTVDRWLHQQKH